MWSVVQHLYHLKTFITGLESFNTANYNNQVWITQKAEVRSLHLPLTEKDKF